MQSSSEVLSLVLKVLGIVAGVGFFLVAGCLLARDMGVRPLLNRTWETIRTVVRASSIVADYAKIFGFMWFQLFRGTRRLISKVVSSIEWVDDEAEYESEREQHEQPQRSLRVRSIDLPRRTT